MFRVIAMLGLAACGSPSTPLGPFSVVIDRVDVETNSSLTDRSEDTGGDTGIDAGVDVGVHVDAGLEAAGCTAAPAPSLAGGEPVEDLRALDVTLCLHASGVSRATVHAYKIDLDQTAVCGSTIALEVHGFAADPEGAWWSLWTPGASVDGCAAGLLPSTWMVSGAALLEGDGLRFDQVTVDELGDGWVRAHAWRIEVTR